MSDHSGMIVLIVLSALTMLGMATPALMRRWKLAQIRRAWDLQVEVYLEERPGVAG